VATLVSTIPIVPTDGRNPDVNDTDPAGTGVGTDDPDADEDLGDDDVGDQRPRVRVVDLDGKSVIVAFGTVVGLLAFAAVATSSAMSSADASARRMVTALRRRPRCTSGLYSSSSRRRFCASNSSGVTMPWSRS
jgi:hypothetical protein